MSAVLPQAVVHARRPAGTGVIVQVHRDAGALHALVPEWEELAADAAEPNPFYEHWMLLPALEAYGEDRFRCIVVWDNGTLVGLLPMRLARGYRGLPVRVLRSWGHRNMLLYTPLVRAKAVAKVAEALLRTRLAPLIELDWVPTGGVFPAASPFQERGCKNACHSRAIDRRSGRPPHRHVIGPPVALVRGNVPHVRCRMEADGPAIYRPRKQ